MSENTMKGMMFDIFMIIKVLDIEQTCSTVAFVNPRINGSKNSERFRISPEVTNLKNITTNQETL